MFITLPDMGLFTHSLISHGRPRSLLHQKVHLRADYSCAMCVIGMALVKHMSIMQLRSEESATYCHWISVLVTQVLQNVRWWRRDLSGPPGIPYRSNDTTPPLDPKAEQRPLLSICTSFSPLTVYEKLFLA